MDISTIAAALGSLNAAKDIIQTLLNIRTDARVSGAIQELSRHLAHAYGQLFEAQAAQAAMLDRNRYLEEELARLKDFLRDAQNYELKQLGPGAFAYAHKQGMEVVAPEHWLCAQCYQQAVKSILQKARFELYHDVFVCPHPHCKAEILVPHGQAPMISTVPGRGGQFGE